MKVLVIYRPNSEHGRVTEEFIRDFQGRFPTITVESFNIDSREGYAMASLYDILSYPGIVVVQNDGSVQKVWSGDVLPLIDEVGSYARS